MRTCFGWHAKLFEVAAKARAGQGVEGSFEVQGRAGGSRVQVQAICSQSCDLKFNVFKWFLRYQKHFTEKFQEAQRILNNTVFE